MRAAALNIRSDGGDSSAPELLQLVAINACARPASNAQQWSSCRENIVCQLATVPRPSKSAPEVSGNPCFLTGPRG